MTEFNYEEGARQDFDNMTKEVSRKVKVYPRNYHLNYEGQEASEDYKKYFIEERVFFQELSSKHEVLSEGQFSVADIRLTFLSSTFADEECIVELEDGTEYKVLELNKIKNVTNGRVIYVKAYGKKLPKR